MGPLRRPRHLWKLWLIACSAALAARVLAQTTTAQPDHQPPLSPVLNESTPDAIPGQYIVVFKPGTTRDVVLTAQSTVKKLGGTVGFTYTSALIGFSAKLPPNAVQALRAIAGVAYIETDQKGSIETIELNPPTGLDRTSERLLPLDNRYTYSETGAGVHVYVIDTGIFVAHNEFGGRASGAFTTVTDGHGTDDCHGHGTLVAATIAGANYGIAKQVTIHAVRFLNCFGGGLESDLVAGVDWVTNNAIHPAVANISYKCPACTAADTAVSNSISSGVTYVIAAGNSNVDACTWSLTSLPTAIIVGAINPTNDTRPSFSNWGSCLDLFAPGTGITSAWPDSIPPLSGCVVVSTTPNAGAVTCSGTSLAAPHVAGVAALYLQNHPLATPAMVWGALHNADNVAATPGWFGVINRAAGSPNELLHWGSLNDGYNDGDPHLVTVDGVHYNFQSAGEFITLRDGDGLEIQTRQTATATTFNPGPDSYDGLATCVSLNTAVAARVGKHRVTYQPNLSGVPDPSGLQLRIDGAVTTLGPQGLNLGSGGRVVKSSIGDGIEIDFPDGTVLIATPGWWAWQSKWYLNVDVFHTPASEGLMGAIAPGSWLPALPNGTSLGPMPTAMHQRYIDLNQKFADAWRVTNKTSLFDYAPGTSTATFTLSTWPQESPPCVIPDNPSAKPLDANVARDVCHAIVGKNRNADCVFDVTATGERGFAKTYLISQRIELGSTRIILSDNKDPSKLEEPLLFTAKVVRNASAAPNEPGRRAVPTGSVQFTLDDSKVERPIKLDSKGQATWKTSRVKTDKHRVAATYIPDKGSVFLPSISLDEIHTAGQ